jgi:DNA-directed RNA polymerase subunit omega
MARITVEDCLTKENNRFALVQLASKRTKQLLQGSKPVIDDNRGNKAVVLALREIASGKVRFMSEEEARLAQQEELEKKIAEAEVVTTKEEVHEPHNGVNAAEAAFSDSDVGDSDAGEGAAAGGAEEEDPDEADAGEGDNPAAEKILNPDLIPEGESTEEGTEQKAEGEAGGGEPEKEEPAQ